MVIKVQKFKYSPDMKLTLLLSICIAVLYHHITNHQKQTIKRKKKKQTNNLEV